MAAKLHFQNVESADVFGQRHKRLKMFRDGLFARVSTNDQQALPKQSTIIRAVAARNDRTGAGRQQVAGLWPFAPGATNRISGGGLIRWGNGQTYLLLVATHTQGSCRGRTGSAREYRPPVEAQTVRMHNTSSA
jgi:hypothetical protein